MHELERRRIVLRLLAERGSVSLQQLTTVLDASEPTVRRDLTRLEEEGLLERVHGGARPVGGAKKTLSGQQPFESTLLQYGEWKRRIGREAARLVTENESIIVTGGSTTFALVEQLGDRNLQVLTTSLPHADYLLRYTNNRVVLPAGEVIREQGVILSPFDQEAFPELLREEALHRRPGGGAPGAHANRSHVGSCGSEVGRAGRRSHRTGGLFQVLGQRKPGELPAFAAQAGDHRRARTDRVPPEAS